MNREVANAIAGTTPGIVSGEFLRHAYAGAPELQASTGGGRWGPEHAYPVLYLGRPLASVIAEAYRRYVDGVEGMRPELVAERKLFYVEANVTNLLDLREPDHLEAVGLDLDALAGPWPACQRVGRAAHQLGMHGVIAPAATGLGLTLAIFENHVPSEEWPRVVATEMWHTLPPDPRVRQQDAYGDPGSA